MIEFRLPADPMAPAFVRASLAAADLPQPLCADAALLASEVVTNAIKHAGMRPTEDVIVRVDRGEVLLHLEVLDTGDGFAPEVRPLPGAGERGGWGLFLLARLARSWGVEREGRRNKVWFELNTA
jgi:anti-sigma regulatory factor (Ser/Thr protein kinase)